MNKTREEMIWEMMLATQANASLARESAKSMLEVAICITDEFLSRFPNKEEEKEVPNDASQQPTNLQTLNERAKAILTIDHEMPKDGQGYWYVSGYGARKYIWDNDEGDILLYLSGRTSITEAGAEKKTAALKELSEELRGSV